MHKHVILVGTIGRTTAGQPQKKNTAETLAAPAAEAAFATAFTEYSRSFAHVVTMGVAGFPHSKPCEAEVSKAFKTLAALFALAGAELHVETCIDGSDRMYSIHHGKVTPLGCLDHARMFPAQIGGAHA